MPAYELPVPETVRAISLHRLYNCRGKRCRLDETQKRILAALVASPHGLNMEQLRGKRPKSYEGYLLTSLSEMRDKLDDFFMYEGRDLPATCSIPELRKGRKAGGELGKYTVQWQMRITETTSVTPGVVKQPSPSDLRSESGEGFGAPQDGGGHLIFSPEQPRRSSAMRSRR
jgi:hypothetical protein